MMFRARLRDLDFGPGPESLEVTLVRRGRHPVGSAGLSHDHAHAAQLLPGSQARPVSAAGVGAPAAAAAAARSAWRGLSSAGAASGNFGTLRRSTVEPATTTEGRSAVLRNSDLGAAATSGDSTDPVLRLDSGPASHLHWRIRCLIAFSRRACGAARLRWWPPFRWRPSRATAFRSPPAVPAASTTRWAAGWPTSSPSTFPACRRRPKSPAVPSTT